MEKIAALKERLKLERKRRQQFFQTHKGEIDEENFAVLKGACITTPVIFLLIYLITPLVLHRWEPTPYHFAFVPLCFVMLVFYGVNRKQARPGHGYTEPLCFLFQLMVILPCIMIDTLGSDGRPAQFFPLLAVVMPTLFFLRGIYQLILLMAAEFLFVFLAFETKKPYFAAMDMLLSIFALVFSTGLLNLLNTFRLRLYRLSGYYKQQSQRDALSGVCTKSFFLEESQRYIEASNPDTCCVLLFMDVDHFKQLNDTLGHEMGDRVLTAIGETLLASFRKEDLVGRYGGDEFVVLMKLRQSPREAFLKRKLEELGDRLQQAILACCGKNLSVSIGAAYAAEAEVELEELIRLADSAMYVAKRSGKRFYNICPYRQRSEKRPEKRKEPEKNG